MLGLSYTCTQESNSFIGLVLKIAVCHPPLFTIFCSTEVNYFQLFFVEFINIASGFVFVFVFVFVFMFWFFGCKAGWILAP